jgi:hypothetical protein
MRRDFLRREGGHISRVEFGIIVLLERIFTTSISVVPSEYFQSCSAQSVTERPDSAEQINDFTMPRLRGSSTFQVDLMNSGSGAAIR